MVQLMQRATIKDNGCLLTHQYANVKDLLEIKIIFYENYLLKF